MPQACGFGLMSIACAFLALAFRLGASPAAKFGLFCFLLFALNWGPNVSTYVMPTAIFPTAVRSTCFGLAVSDQA